MRWVAVVGYEGRYEVSDTGLVRSLDQQVVTRRRAHKTGDGMTEYVSVRKGRILKPGSLGTSRHLHVVLAGRSDRTVHSLVLEAFVGPCPPGMMARHLDDDPTNNSLGNLCWGTRSENSHDAVRNGRHWQVNKTHCKHGHPLSGDNVKLSAKGYRHCRTCSRRRAVEYLARKRAAS